MAIRNRILAFIYRIGILGFGLATLSLLILSEGDNGNYGLSVLYFDTEITLFACAILLAEIIANGIGLPKGPRGLAPGVWSPLALAAVALETTDLLAYPLAMTLVSDSYFTSGSPLVTIFANIAFPLLFLSDWLLFGEKGTVKWFAPLYWLVYPVLFFLFNLVRHAIDVNAKVTCSLFDGSEFTTGSTLPSWFSGNEGWNGVIFSAVAMLALFAAVAYAVIFVNNLLAGRYFRKKPLVP